MRILYVFLVLVLLVSCGDDPVDVTVQEEIMMPLSVGNYWIYESFAVNSLNQRKYRSDRIDSLYVNKEVTYKSLNCFQLIRISTSTWDNRDIKKDTVYYSYNEKILQKYYSFGRASVLNQAWVLLLNKNKKEWINTSVNSDFTLLYKGAPMNANFKHISTSFVEKISLLLKGKNIDSRKVRIKDDRKIEFEPEDKVLATNFSKRETYLKFANGIGIVQERMLGYVDYWSTNPLIANFEFKNIKYDGLTRDLIRWSVK